MPTRIPRLIKKARRRPFRMQDLVVDHAEVASPKSAVEEQVQQKLWPLRLMAHLAPENDGRGGANSGTLMVRHQLPGHTYTIDAICFNDKLQHILTADRATIRLWSLRKELKRVNLTPSIDSKRSGNSGLPEDSNQPVAEALIVKLIYARQRNVYICVFGGEPRRKGPNNFVDPAVVKVFHPSLAVLLQFTAHTSPVIAASFHQVSEQLCTSSTSVSVKVWNFESTLDDKARKEQHILPAPSPLLNASVPAALRINMRNILQDHDRPLSLLYTPNDARVVFGCGGTDVWVWSLENGTLLCSVRGLHNFVTDMITALRYVPVLSELTAAYDDGTIATWSFPLQFDVRPIICREYPSHRGRVNSMVLSDDSLSLFSCGADGDVRQYDAVHGIELGRLPLAASFHIAFKSGTRRVYPPFALVHGRISGPKGSKEVLFSVAGSSITVVEVRTQRWQFSSGRGRVLSTEPVGGDGDGEHVAVLTDGNAVKLLEVQTGRTVVNVVPAARASRKSKGSMEAMQNKRLRSSFSTGNLQVKKSGFKSSAGLSKGMAGIKRGGLTAEPISTKRDLSYTVDSDSSSPTYMVRERKLASIGADSTELQVVKMAWWRDVQHCLLGWSDGAIEVFDPRRGGIRIRLLQNREQQARPTAIVVLNVPAHGSRAGITSDIVSVSRGTTKTLKHVWGSTIIGDTKDDPNLQLTKMCPPNELSGPWGGPVRYRQTVSEMASNIREEHERMLAKFTVVSASADGHILLWDTVKGSLISATRAHSGPVIALLEVSTGYSRTSSDEASLRMSFPPPTKSCMVSIGVDGVVKVWSTWRPGRLTQLQFFLAQPNSACTPVESDKRGTGSPNRRKSNVTACMILRGTRVLLLGYDDGTMQAWELIIDKKVEQNSEAELAPLPFWSNRLHSHSVTGLCNPLTGNHFASCSLDGSVMMWSGALKNVHSYQANETRSTPGQKPRRSENTSFSGWSGMPVIELIRTLSLDIPLFSIHFIAQDSAFVVTHEDGMTVCKANMRSGIVQRQYILEAKRKLKEKLESPPNETQETPQKNTENIIETTEVIRNEDNARSFRIEEKNDVGMAVSLKKSTYPITGYVPYDHDAEMHSEAVANHSRAETSDVKQSQIASVEYIAESDERLAMTLHQASLGGEIAVEPPKLSSWGQRDGSASVPSPYPIPPGAIIAHSTQVENRQSDMVRAKPCHSTVLRGTSNSIEESYFEAENSMYIEEEVSKTDITHNFALSHDLARPTSTRGSSMRPFSTGEILQTDEEIQNNEFRKRFVEERPGSREGIIKIVVSGTESTSKKTNNTNVESKLQPPLLPSIQSDLKEPPKSLDGNAISALRQAFEEAVHLESADGLPFVKIPDVLKTLSITTEPPAIWLLWNIHESLFKLKRPIYATAMVHIAPPSSAYQRKLIEERTSRRTINFDNFLVLSTAYIAYLRHNIEQQEARKTSKPKSLPTKRNIDHRKTIVKYNDLGESTKIDISVAVSKGVSEARMEREQDERNKRAALMSKKWFKNQLNLPDAWDGDPAKGGLNLVPKNKWYQHTQLAINTLLAFSAQLGTEGEWPKLPSIYVDIQKEKIRIMKEFLPDDGLRLNKKSKGPKVLPPLGKAFARPIPLRKMLHLITQIWRDKEAQDVVQDRQNHPRETMPEFLYEWHLKTFGLIELAGPKLIRFLESLIVYREVPACRMMGRFALVITRARETVKSEDDNPVLALLSLEKTSLELFCDAQQWLNGRAELALDRETIPLVNMLTEDSPESERLRGQTNLSMDGSKISLVSTYRALECAKAMFSGPPDLLDSIRSHIDRLPIVSERGIHEYVESDCVLEAIVHYHRVWLEEIEMQKMCLLAQKDRPYSPKSSVVISMPGMTKSIDVIDGHTIFRNSTAVTTHGQPTSGVLIDALKGLLDAMIEEEGGQQKGSGIITAESFKKLLRRSLLWSGKILSDGLLRNLVSTFRRSQEQDKPQPSDIASDADECYVSHIDFWSRLYQTTTSKEILPMVHFVGNAVSLPISVLESLVSIQKTGNPKEAGPSNDNTVASFEPAQNSSFVTRGHGRGTRSLFLKLAQAIANDNPECETMTLNLETTTPAGSVMFRPNQVSPPPVGLEVVASQAPFKTSKLDVTDYNSQLDHGVHDRSDKNLRYPAREKHPSSFIRKGMQSQEEMLRDFGQALIQGEEPPLPPDRPGSTTSSLFSQPSISRPGSSKSIASQQVVLAVSRRATTPAAALTSASSVANKMVVMKTIKGCTVFEQDQVEAALRCVSRTATNAQHFEILMSLLSDASPAEILTSTALRGANSDDLSDEELRRAKAVVSASYHFSAQARRAAKSVLSTAVTKAEVVAICTTLIAGYDSSEIIRASDVVLPTAATRRLGNLAKENILAAIKNNNSWLNTDEIDRIGDYIGKVDETSEGLEILRMSLAGKLLETSLQDIKESSSAQTEIFDTEERDKVLASIKACREALRLDAKQEQVCLSATSSAMTKAEALAILVSIVRGDDAVAVAQAADQAETEVMSVTHAIRAASRRGERDFQKRIEVEPMSGLTIIDPPTLEGGIIPKSLAKMPPPSWVGAGTDHPPVKDVSDRLYPASFRDQPPHWIAAAATSRPSVSPTSLASDKYNEPVQFPQPAGGASSTSRLSSPGTPQSNVPSGNDLLVSTPSATAHDFLTVENNFAGNLSKVNPRGSIQDHEEILLQEQHRVRVLEENKKTKRRKKPPTTGVYVAPRGSVFDIPSIRSVKFEDEELDKELDAGSASLKTETAVTSSHAEYGDGESDVIIEERSEMGGDRAWTTQGCHDTRSGDFLEPENLLFIDSSISIPASERRVSESESVARKSRLLTDDLLLSTENYGVGGLLDHLDHASDDDVEVENRDWRQHEFEIQKTTDLSANVTEVPASPVLPGEHIELEAVNDNGKEPLLTTHEQIPAQVQERDINVKDDDDKNAGIADILKPKKEPINLEYVPPYVEAENEILRDVLFVNDATDTPSKDLIAVQPLVEKEHSSPEVSPSKDDDKTKGSKNLKSSPDTNLIRNEVVSVVDEDGPLILPMEENKNDANLTEESSSSVQMNEQVNEACPKSDDKIELSFDKGLSNNSMPQSNDEVVEGVAVDAFAEKHPDEFRTNEKGLPTIVDRNAAISEDRTRIGESLPAMVEDSTPTTVKDTLAAVEDTLPPVEVAETGRVTDEDSFEESKKIEDEDEAKKTLKHPDERVNASITSSSLNISKEEELLPVAEVSSQATAHSALDKNQKHTFDEENSVVEHDENDWDKTLSAAEEDFEDTAAELSEDECSDNGVDDDIKENDEEQSTEEDYSESGHEKDYSETELQEKDDESVFVDVEELETQTPSAPDESSGGAEVEQPEDTIAAAVQPVVENDTPSIPLIDEISDAESDAMDSGDDELSLEALQAIQKESMNAKRALKKLQKARDEAKRSSKRESAADRNAALKEIMLAMEDVEHLNNKLNTKMMERATRDERRSARLSKRAVPRKRKMEMDGLDPEFKLSFSDNLKFKPFQLMKGQASVPQWEADDAIDESDGPDSDESCEEKEELMRWRAEKEKMKGTRVTDTGQALSAEFLYESNPVQLPDGWEYGPPMVQTLHPLWKKWFKMKEKKIMSWDPLEIEDEEVDREAKLLEEQKNANKFDDQDQMGMEVVTREQKMQKKRARASGLWNKLRAHTKTKWRMSRMLRKTRFKQIHLEELTSGQSMTDTNLRGEVEGDDLSGYKYYAIDVLDIHSIVTIILVAEKGDPDIYVSTSVLPTKTDHTWQATTIGKKRLVIYPNDANFVVGRYVLGVYSRVPAKYKIELDITGGEYTSASLDTVVLMTKKFNTIAEGFDRVEEMRISKPPEKKEKKLTVEERAALFYENQHEAELTIARLKREASIVIQAETRKTKKKIKVIDKALKSSNRESAMAQAFYQALQEDFGADHVMNDESDDESEDDGNCEPVEQFVEELSKPEEEILLEKRRLQDAVAAQGYLSSDLSEESEMGELSSEEDIDTATNPLYSSVNQIDKMKLYRPKFGMTRNERIEWNQRQENPPLEIPKPSFADRRRGIEKANRVRAQLAKPKRQTYSVNSLGKTFKPSRKKS